MLLSGNNIRVYDNELAQNKSFFTGHINDQAMTFDPLVTGYSFILWTKIPFWLNDRFGKGNFQAMTQKNFTAFDGLEDMVLSELDYEHSFNGNKHQVASTLEKANETFSITHKEYSGSPIGNMYKYWVSSIRDPRTGIATYPREHNTEYSSKNHTGELLYIVTRPDANNVDHKNIEFAAYYTNVMPTKIQMSHWNYSIADHDMVDYEQNFTATLHIGSYVDDFAQVKLKETYSFVTEGMFDPNVTNGDVAGSDITEFNIENVGKTGTGGGDLIY